MPAILHEQVSTDASITTPRSQNLPWQSALFALTVVAASTALQHPESRDGLSAEHILALRSSPFYCLYDTINVFFQIRHHTRAMSLREALRTVAATHLGSGVGARYFANKYLLPAIAVLQFVILLACKGVPWTQTFGAMYMSSYLTRALLGRFEKPLGGGASSSAAEKPESSIDRGESTPAQETPSSKTAPSWSWLLPQIFLWIWCLSYFATDGADETTILGKDPLWYAILVIPVTITIALLPLISCIMVFYAVIVVCGGIDLAISVGPSVVFLYASYRIVSRFYPRSLVVLAEIFDAQVQTICVSVDIPIALVLIYWQGTMLGPFQLCRFIFTYLDNKPTWTSFFENYGISFELYMSYAFQLAGGTLMLVAAAAATYVVFRVLFVGKLAKLNPLSRSGVTNSTWVCAFTLLVNVVVAGVYYSQLYDAQKTSRPSWAGILGHYY